ncbi:MAG: indolepyruvate oxidoreductase subunit beta [Clostridiales bacterium]|nr:indolepyruvate oxidoreductase subunit beta [Clostridiales bacterium]MBQ2816969.1 indolepyruvate oxidoreductase subunit beta [Clostridia bacterium]MBQ4637369.1 indolepyruvate oxidoreductase subunit beta [Clostridia bacterium]
MLEIVIVGVGGQGTLLASRILGALAIDRNMDVKVSEVHGMSQRGGSVITHVRIGTNGETVYSPLVEDGGADFVLSFEALEAYRAARYLKAGGMIVTGDQQILPMPVITGAAKYPADALGKAGEMAKVLSLDALKIAEECGSVRSANVVLIGSMARYLPFTKEEVRKAVALCVPPKTVDVNLAAFEKGYELGAAL